MYYDIDASDYASGMTDAEEREYLEAFDQARRTFVARFARLPDPDSQDDDDILSEWAADFCAQLAVA